MSELIRKDIYTPAEVYESIKGVVFSPRRRRVKINFFGDDITANSERYQVFFGKGMSCISCGIKGNFFAKEKTKKDVSYHLNLYALDENGDEVLMTKDHIIPKSKGGKNCYENYQCMCIRCNMKKGDMI